MSVYFDVDDIDASAARVREPQVERVLDERRKVSSLWPLAGMLAVTGLLLTLALRTEADWLYIVGLVLTVFWAAGFFLARGEARWYRW